MVLKAHVDFKGIKRSVSFEKGDDVLILRYLIMVAFADVGLDKLPPANVELLKYDEGVQEYVPLPVGTKLQEDLKVKLEVTGSKVKCIILYLYMFWMLYYPKCPLNSPP